MAKVLSSSAVLLVALAFSVVLHFLSSSSLVVVHAQNCVGNNHLSGTSPSTVLSISAINGILDEHNKARQEVNPTAATMPMLKWNQALATHAQNYMDGCPGLVHSSSASRSNVGGFSYVGENLAWGTSSTSYNVNIGGATSTRAWNDEVSDWQYAGVGSDKNCRDGGTTCAVGHYTQNIWAATTDVGCGYKQCTSGRSGHYWICLYGPGGNYRGQNPYEAAGSAAAAPGICGFTTTTTTAASGGTAQSNSCQSVSATMSLGGDWTQTMITGAVRTSLEAAITADLALHLSILANTISITSLTINSGLDIAFTYSDCSGNPNVALSVLSGLSSSASAMPTTRAVFLTQGGTAAQFSVASASGQAAGSPGAGPGAPPGPSKKHEIGFIIGIILGLILLLGFIIIIVVLWINKGGSRGGGATSSSSNSWASTTKSNPVAAGGGSSSRSTKTTTTTYRSTTSTVSVPAGYYYDKDTGYYWSNSDHLYWDKDSGHYYDPNSDQWYDPARDKWYYH